MIVRKIVERLRQEREARKLTQADVGTAIGLTRQAIAATEGGRTAPNLDTLGRWADAVGCVLEVRVVPKDPADAEVPWSQVAPESSEVREVTEERDDLAEQVTALAQGYRHATAKQRTAVRALLALLADD